MTTNPDYSMATNMAYKVLSDFKNLSLPIYVQEIIKKYPDIKVFTYMEAELKYGLNLDVLMRRSSHGFTMLCKGRRIILYNEKKDFHIKRFTLAHELGHCILEHISDDEVSDKEANCFARNILCPIPIIRELQIETIEDYMEVFSVSEPMASASMNFADYDFDLIENNLYRRLQDLLMRHMMGYSLAELHENPVDSTSVFKQVQREYTYIATTRRPSTAHPNYGHNFYVGEEERELLDRLKLGE